MGTWGQGDMGTWLVQRRLPTPARWLKPRATQCEGRLRGLNEPAKAGFAPKSRGLQPPGERRCNRHA